MDISEIIESIEDRQRDIAAYVHALALSNKDAGETRLLEELEKQMLEYADDLRRLDNIIKTKINGEDE